MTQSLTDFTSQDVYELMLSGRENDRDSVQEAVIAGHLTPDRTQLRRLVMDALESRYYPGSEQEVAYGQGQSYVDNSIARTRTWLVSILAIISDDDSAAHDHLKQYFNQQFEANPWIPYWILFGYIRTHADLMPALAESIIEHPEPLVRMTGIAYLAQRPQKGGAEARALADQRRQMILDALGANDENVVWGTLRALRLVHLQNTWTSIRERLCEIVEQGAVHFTTYDAIVALGYVKPDSHSAQDPAEVAAESLVRFIERNRTNPLQHGSRVKALSVLGQLRVEKSAHTLMEEVIDENPAIAREAAYALEATLGVRRAINEIVVEAATDSEDGKDHLRDFANALRWMKSQDEIVEELETQMGSSALETQEIARQLLAEIGGPQAFQKLAAVRRSVDQFTAMLERTEESVRKTYEESIARARIGFESATRMDWIVFWIGVILVVVSSFVALFLRGDLTSWVAPVVSGGLGVAGILHTLFISRPRKRIEEAVSRLMELQTIYMGYLRQLTQTDQAYTRLLLSEDLVDPMTVEKYTEIIKNRMSEALGAINKK